MVEKHNGLWDLVEVKFRIEEAMNHVASSKWKSKSLYVQRWLRRDAEKIRKNGSPPSSDEDAMKREAAELAQEEAQA